MAYKWEEYRTAHWYRHTKSMMVLATIPKINNYPPSVWNDETHNFLPVLQGHEHKPLAELKLLVEAIVAMEEKL